VLGGPDSVIGMNEEPKPTSQWSQWDGRPDGQSYARRFGELAASGADVHGEASFVASLVHLGGSILDAGCGTGRVAIRLAEQGYDCIGVDLDPSMLAEALRRAPEARWILADLATVTPADAGRADFDAIVAAGNVIPLLAAGALCTTVHALVRLLAPGAVLISGFGLAARTLPARCRPTSLADYDRACEQAGLVCIRRCRDWAGNDYVPASDYAVSVHAKAC
jgi:SAM-dependent methyltransferase